MMGSNIGHAMVKLWIRLVNLAFLAFTCCALGDVVAQVPELTKEQWRAEVRQLGAELGKRHVNLEFRGMRRSTFDSAVATLERRVSELPAHGIIVEMSRLVAMVGDAHTELSLSQERIGFRRYPVGLYFFGEELRLIAAPESLKHLLGERIVRIGGVAVDKAVARIAPLLSRDNVWEIAHSAPAYLTLGEVVHAVGLSDRPDRVTLSLAAKDGGTYEVELDAVSRSNFPPLTNVTVADGGSLPLYRRDVGQPYRWTWLEDSKTLYVQYNQCRDATDGPSIARFAEELFRFADSQNVQRFVLDVRLNTGGNYHKSRPLVDGIGRRSALNRDGAVWVITGRRTFSAATMTALHMRQKTKARLVGEPSRGNPNGTYNMETLRLGRSRIEVDYTDRLHEPAPELVGLDALPLYADVPVDFVSYRAGRDPVLEWILAQGS